MTPSNRRVRESVPPPPEAPEPAAPPMAVEERRPAPWLASLRTGAGIALVLASSLGVAWAEVTGNERRPTSDVVAESGLTLGTSVFVTDLDAARAQLLADPWIADVSLARRLPGTIFVHVTERRPAALVALGVLWLATADGEPFKRLEPSDPVDLPLVTGLGPDLLADDREGCMRKVRSAIDLAAEYDHSGIARRLPLEEVHVQADGGFALVVGRGATELVLGAAPFRRKLDQATRVVAELDGRGAKADAIMLDNETRPERVVVRMR